MFKMTPATTIPGKIGQYGFVGAIIAVNATGKAWDKGKEYVSDARKALKEYLKDPIADGIKARQLYMEELKRVDRNDQHMRWSKNPKHHCDFCVRHSKDSNTERVSCHEAGITSLVHGAYLAFVLQDFPLALAFFRLLSDCVWQAEGEPSCFYWIRVMKIICHASLGQYREAGKCYRQHIEKGQEKNAKDFPVYWNVKYSLEADHIVFCGLKEVEPSLREEAACDEVRRVLQEGMVNFFAMAMMAYPQDKAWTSYWTQVARQAKQSDSYLHWPFDIHPVLPVYEYVVLGDASYVDSARGWLRNASKERPELAEVEKHYQTLELDKALFVPPEARNALRAVAWSNHTFGDSVVTFWKPTHCHVCANFVVGSAWFCTRCKFPCHDACRASCELITCKAFEPLSPEQHAKRAPWLMSPRKMIMLMWKKGPMVGFPKDLIRYLMQFLEQI